MALPESTVVLTDAQISFYSENGYLSIEQLTTEAELERMRAAYDEIFERRAGRDEGREFDLAGTDEDDAKATLPQILEPRDYAEGLRNTLYEANALAISEQLLGEGIVQRGSHAIFKPARYGAATPWHQDEAYWNPGKQYLSLSVWMPLQEATMENGCMQFVPGSHKLDVLPHHNIDHNPKIQGLEVDDGHVHPDRIVACPLPAGGATIHDAKTLHYTGPNISNSARRAFVLMFHIPQPLLETPRDFYWQRSTETYADKKRKAAKAAGSTA